MLAKHFNEICLFSNSRFLFRLRENKTKKKKFFNISFLSLSYSPPPPLHTSVTGNDIFFIAFPLSSGVASKETHGEVKKNK